MATFGKIFSTNKDVEKEGIWLTYGEGLEVRIARAGGSNKTFAARYDVLTKPYRRLIQMEVQDKEVMEGLMRRLYAETVVKDWKGVTDENGNEVSFSVEACVEQFEKYPDLFADVVDNSTKIANYRDEVREADAKN